MLRWGMTPQQARAAVSTETRIERRIRQLHRSFGLPIEATGRPDSDGSTQEHYVWKVHGTTIGLARTLRAGDTDWSAVEGWSPTAD